jgi:CO dehydrogenase nickel-insertion accessory protein CooC1
MAAAKANGVEYEGEIHFSLQGKGGVGKSLVASFLAQYFLHRRSTPIRCIDTDPVNQTFSQYRELRAERLELLRDRSVDQRAFDGRNERNGRQLHEMSVYQ